jgi:hypothetical protein
MDTLRTLLDAPWCRADLLHLEKLVAAIEAVPGATAPAAPDLSPGTLPPPLPSQGQVTVAAPVHGTVRSSPAGITCGSGGSGCTASFAPGTVTLTATADTGWAFSGWSGACSGTGTCSVTVASGSAATVAALFTSTSPTTGTIAVTRPAHGTVTSSPAGLGCGSGGSACSASFSPGDVVLTASAEGGYAFSGWTGACAGTGPCTLHLVAGGDVQVGATFTATTPPAPGAKGGCATAGSSGPLALVLAALALALVRGRLVRDRRRD